MTIGKMPSDFHGTHKQRLHCFTNEGSDLPHGPLPLVRDSVVTWLGSSLAHWSHKTNASSHKPKLHICRSHPEALSAAALCCSSLLCNLCLLRRGPGWLCRLLCWCRQWAAQLWSSGAPWNCRSDLHDLTRRWRLRSRLSLRLRLLWGRFCSWLCSWSPGGMWTCHYLGTPGTLQNPGKTQ